MNEDLPPSAKFIVFVIEEAGGSIARDELAEETDLPDSTIRDALDRLEELEVVRRDRDSERGDLRFVRVTVTENGLTAAKSGT